MVAEAVAHLLPDRGTRPLTADEALAVEDILDAAAAWRAGDLPWQEAARVGALTYYQMYEFGREVSTTTYGRFVAMLTVPLDDPRRPALTALCDLLVRQQGIELTNHGAFEREELTNVTVRNR